MKHPFDIWQEHCGTHPERAALGDSAGVLTGRQALLLVDRLCVILERHLGPDQKSAGIGIFLPRDNVYLAAMFAAWRMGHYFIPFNTRWPQDHLLKIIEKAKPVVVLSSVEIPGVPCVLVKDLSAVAESTAEQQQRWLENRSRARLVYTIFTSGSTGEQKGVMISLPAYQAYVEWVEAYFRDFAGNRALLITAELTFDITLGDIAFALAFGTEIHVSPDPRNMIWHAKLIQDRKIDTFYSVPSTIRHLFAWVKDRRDVDFGHITLVVSGGDVFAWELIDLVKSLSPRAEFHNVYGPTEVTINCVATRVDDLIAVRKQGRPVPIGRPFGHLPVKLWTEVSSESGAGELLIGGVQCMDGYIGDPELTQRAFVTLDGVRYYRTGDLVTSDDNGFYYVLGRIDNLVKVKGYRINPAEIDNVLSETGLVKEVKTITLREGEADKQIVTFYVPSAGAQDVPERLERHSRAKLPPYMVPQAFVALSGLPTGSSGKYDVKKLQTHYLVTLKGEVPRAARA